MTADKSVFHEIAFEGHFERCHGLVLGLFLGSGSSGRLFFAHEEGVTESFGERLRAAVGLHAPICHVIADTPIRELYERFADALAAHGVRLAEARVVRGAKFSFAFRAFGARHTAEFRALMAALPPGLDVQGGEPRERIDPQAAGVEAYTPAHAYESEADGIISGRVDLVIEARRRLGALPLVQAERIDLELEAKA